MEMVEQKATPDGNYKSDESKINQIKISEASEKPDITPHVVDSGTDDKA